MNSQQSVTIKGRASPYLGLSFMEAYKNNVTCKAVIGGNDSNFNWNNSYKVPLLVPYLSPFFASSNSDEGSMKEIKPFLTNNKAKCNWITYPTQSPLLALLLL